MGQIATRTANPGCVHSAPMSRLARGAVAVHAELLFRTAPPPDDAWVPEFRARPALPAIIRPYRAAAPDCTIMIVIARVPRHQDRSRGVRV